MSRHQRLFGLLFTPILACGLACPSASASASAAAVSGAVSAASAGPGGGCAAPRGVYADSTPWAQRQLELNSVAPLSTGTGQSVAIIGTGVDSSNAQFGPGQVRAPIDLLHVAGPADCDGRGTFAAGVVGAQPNPRTTVVGVAPGAVLIPIRYTQSGESADAATPDQLGAAVSAAVSARARIILIAVPVTVDSPALHASVAAAMSAGAVVVSPAAAGKGGGSTYPTAYAGSPGFDNVVAVAGVSASGAPVTLESGRYLSIGAPGSGLVGLAAGARGGLGHLWPTNDPIYAAAYVAGVIADVASYRPSLSLTQVVQRVLATAGRGNGVRTEQLGWGLVDPLRALTAELPKSVTPEAMAASVAPARRVLPARPVAVASPAGRSAGLVTLGGLVTALAVALVAVTIRRGGRRRWRAGRLSS